MGRRDGAPRPGRRSRGLARLLGQIVDAAPDPHRIEAGLPPYVPDTARRARARLPAEDARVLPVVVGHGDLSVQNTRRSPPTEPGGTWSVVVHGWTASSL